MKRWISFLAAAALLLTVVPTARLDVRAEEILPGEGRAVSGAARDTGKQTAQGGQNIADAAEGPEVSGDSSKGSSAAVMPENAEGPGMETVLPDSEDSEDGDGETRKEELQTQEGILLMSEKPNTGEVTVTLEAGLFFGSRRSFYVILYSVNGAEQTEKGRRELVLPVPSEDSTEAARTAATFDDLADGTYRIRVDGEGVLPYTQQIEVKGLSYEVCLAAGELPKQGSAENLEIQASGHPGLLIIGDVDGNDKIDGRDRERLVDAIDMAYIKSSESGFSGAEDLNGDGKADLADLVYFAKGLGQKEQEATLQVSVPAVLVRKVEAPGTREAEGSALSAGELVNNADEEKSVKLIPTDEEGNAAEISAQHPVNLEFDLAGSSETGVEMDGIMIATGAENPMSEGSVDVTYTETDGSGHAEDKTVKVPVSRNVHFLTESDVRVEIDARGNLVVDLGKQVAVKKVSLSITKMSNKNDLAEISKVEFVNGMKDRIPEPSLDIPKGLAAKASDQKFSLTWEQSVNVTGYEVRIETTDAKGEKTHEVTHVSGTALEVSSFGGDKLKNYRDYLVSVQSVNGTWRSGYSEQITVTPKPTGKPAPPDNLKVTGGYKSITASWKAMGDASSYHVYYKKSSQDDSRYVCYKKNLTANSCVIGGLEDTTEYTVRVSGVNELGEGGYSLPATAATTNIDPADMPKYKLINVGKPGTDGCHIVSITRKGGVMVDSALDRDGNTDADGHMTAWGAVDKDPASAYYKDTWNDGGYWDLGQNGLFVEFDQEYELNNIALQELSPQGTEYYYVKVRSWTADGRESLTDASVRKQKDSGGRVYYRIQLPERIKAKKLQIGLGRYWTTTTTSISEIYFYYYDSLMDEIMDMYADDLHTVLKKDVTQNTIDVFRSRVNTPDKVSGELSPDKELMEKELQTAEQILNDQKLRDSVEIYNTISTNDKDRGFGGLNAWQPLGVVAAADEELTVYVGHNTRKTGESTNLQLIATQYHAEASAMSKVVTTLKVGPNTVKIPKIWTQDIESGGALYVQYTGNSSHDRYAVRVSGGVQVPKLDLYRVTDRSERLKRAKEYVKELEEYTADMSELHQELHRNSDNPSVNRYEYSRENCILGASDIMLDTMMLSLPAQQILAGAKDGADTVEAQAERIVTSMDAMEEMMHLFYQHKGLNADAKDVIDQIPNRHLNIRYQRMFAGAFMYASGDHIGIEYPETKGMFGSSLTADADGKYKSGHYFGWGIAHEIGHCINQSAYAVAEVTNNYFSVLAQADETNEGVRFEYGNVYKKVTSGAKGPASNVFTQLGMYWQLHLAYDNGYNYKTYKDHSEQLSNLFFARVDTYARTPSKAPKAEKGGEKLTLCGNKDQDLMRLCCAAAEKNILEFFERWGKTPDEDTVRYASQFEKETKALFYVSDEARVYRLTHGGSSLTADGKTEAVGSGTRAEVNKNAADQVDFTLTNTLDNPDDLLGYEITRGTISGGEMKKEVVGFTTSSAYSDHISVMNNRAVYYEVAVVDKYLNRSAAKALEPLKIAHDGSLDKTDWTVSTMNLEATSRIIPEKADDRDPCDPVPEDPAAAAIDHNVNSTYTAIVRKEDGEEKDSAILMEFNRELVVTGFKYTAPADQAISKYTAYMRQGDGSWLQAAEGSFDGSRTENGQMVYFANADNKYISTYGATAMKLVLHDSEGSGIAVSELDLLGVTGDNVDFRKTEGDGSMAAIGILGEDYHYDKENPDNYIPKDSVIFTGSYKGNAAYNVVLLYDQDGNIVGGTDPEGTVNADQIILADVPEEGNIADVKDGTWIYWVSPEDGKVPNVSSIRKVRAELYRVNDAGTNEGQRLVSDSMFETVPEKLPSIRLSGETGGSAGQ